MQSLQAKPPFARNHLIRDASWQAVYDCMKADASIHVFGEGAEVKAHYDAKDIERDFSDRVHTMPISEDGNTNFAVGASLAGVKPIVDVISSDFLYRTLDSICNTAAKLNFLRPDETPRTIVIRAEFFTGGPTTGQRIESLFTHIPDIRVVVPSTPRDAYALMKGALIDSGVTIFFEDREIDDSEEFTTNGSELRYVGQKGGVTILAYGVMRQRVERLLNNWKESYQPEGYEGTRAPAELYDMPVLAPFNFISLLNSPYILLKTRKLLIVEPDITYGGIGAEIVAQVAERRPDIYVKRLGARKQTIGASRSYHNPYPTDEEVIGAIRDLIDARNPIV